MGMTDKQFASYQAALLRELKRIENELVKVGVKNQDLEILIRDLENEIKRP